MNGLEKTLKGATYRKEAVDLFLDENAHKWARFDSELGYTLCTSTFRDGMDGCWTLQQYNEKGYRKQINFPDQTCRINTYGDSFTQGAQVSDGETWQEVLAAHFCEPIRNFGIGGQGVYHAYRRMLRTEATDLATDHIIMNLWGDDHQRSITPWRWLTYANLWQEAAQDELFHGNPWCHAWLDQSGKELVEIENPFPKPEDLYKLCDQDFVWEFYKDNPVVHINATFHYPGEVDPKSIIEFAETIGLTDLDFSSSDAARHSALRVYNEYAWEVSKHIMDRVKAFGEKNNKRILILLSYPSPSVRLACEGMDREDPSFPEWHSRSFREYLDHINLPCIDTLPDHVEDFRQHNLTPRQYEEKYYIGHYKPHGNYFFAHAIKDRVAKWLSPEPPAYRGLDRTNLIRFKGYIPGGES